MDSSGSFKNFWKQIFFSPSPVNFLLFGFSWLMLGLSLGLSTLLGPVRWATQLQALYPGIPNLESLLVKVIIALLALITALLAAYFVRLIGRYKEKHLRFLIFIFLLLSGSSTVLLILNPHAFKLFESAITVYNARFVFGGYPSKEQMEKLKLDGYSGIITLLNEDIITEKPLLERERKMAQEVGIPLIELPLLPWLDSPRNQDSIDKMIEIAQSNTGRYYIHCYLGLDRTKVIERTIAKYSPQDQTLSVSTLNSLESIRSLERGAVIQLQKDLYLIPLPTQSEMTRHILDGDIKDVISFFDTENNAKNQTFVKQQSDFYDKYFLPYKNIPYSVYPYDPEKTVNLARQMQNQPRPLVIETLSTESPEAEALTLAITTNLPPLPPSLFSLPMSGGFPRVVETNVAIGPPPRQQEYRNYLYNRGIRTVIYLGEGPENQDRLSAEKAGLKWMQFPSFSKEVEGILKEGGPYYLYGPGIMLNDQITNHTALQRGLIDQLRVGVYQTPFPTMDEIETLFPRSWIKKVLFFTTNEEEKRTYDTLSQRLTALGIESMRYAIDPKEFDSDTVLEAAREAWKSPSPFVVVINPNLLFLKQAFKQAYYADVEPMPPALFSPPLKKGSVRVLAPNIGSGPAPQPEEFRDYFYVRGVENFVLFGSDNWKIAKKDREITTLEGFNFTTAEPISQFVYSKLGKTKKPTYLYTDSNPLNASFLFLNEVKGIENRILSRLGPPIPALPLVYPRMERETFFEALRDTGEPELQAFSWEGLKGRYLPDVKTTLMLSPLLIIYILLSGTIAIAMKNRGVGVPYTRKTFHFLIFTLAGVLQLSLQIPSVVLFGSIVSLFVLYAVIRGEGFPFYEIMARPTDYPSEGYYILMPLLMTAVGGLLSYFFFGMLMVVGIFACGFGDAIGEVIGRKFGKHSFQTFSLGEIPSIRSLEGSAAVFIVSFLAAMFSLYFLEYPTLPTLLTSLIVASAVVVVEALSSHGLDNLTVQLTGSGVAFLSIRYLFGI